MTKATYDAIGNHFRSLWGKEAGWAHSVLFTADLRAFSAKLLMETDLKEESIKKEEDGTTVLESFTKFELATEGRVKRELGDSVETTVKVEDVASSKRIKRRKRT